MNGRTMLKCKRDLFSTRTASKILSEVVIALRIASLHVASLRVASLRIASLRIASLRIASLRIASLRIATLRIATLRIASLHVATVGIVFLSNGCAHIPQANPLCAPGPFGERIEEQELPFEIRSIPCEYAKCWTIPVDDEGGIVLVDTGMDPHAKELLLHLQKRHLSVRAVLLTHGHLDHAGAAHLFAAQGIPVYLHEPDLPFLQKQRRHHALLPRVGQFFLPTPIAPKEIQSPADRTWIHFSRLSIQLVHLPGHTPGSTAFLVGDVLFTGDALVGPNPGGLCAAPPQVNESNDAAWRTLSRLADVPFSTVADGHYGVTRDAKRALQTSKRAWRKQLKSRP